MVSVVIPVRNGQKTLREAVESALNQTKKPFEIIIVDDGSTDETKRIAEKIMREHPGIVKVLSSSERGTSAARNLGVEFAKSDFVAFLDADDSWAPRKIERQLSDRLLSERLISLTYASYFQKSDEIVGHSRKYSSAMNLALDIYGNQEMPSVLSSWLMSKKTFEFIGPFDTRYTYAQDYEFIFRGLKKGVELSLTCDYLTNYRINAQGVTTLHHKQQKLFALHAQLSDRYRLEDPQTFAEGKISSSLIDMKAITSGALIRKALCVDKSKPYWLLLMGFHLISAFMISPKNFRRKLLSHSRMIHRRSK